MVFLLNDHMHSARISLLKHFLKRFSMTSISLRSLSPSSSEKISTYDSHFSLFLNKRCILLSTVKHNIACKLNINRQILSFRKLLWLQQQSLTYRKLFFSHCFRKIIRIHKNSNFGTCDHSI